MLSSLKPSIANAVVIGKAGDAGETETCMRRRRATTPNPASMTDPRRPKPITSFWFLADRLGIRVLTDTGFCLAGAATGADCLTCLGYAMTTGCSCCQSRGLGVGEGVGDGVGVGTGAGAIAWYLAIR